MIRFCPRLLFFFSFYENAENPSFCTEVYEVDDLNEWIHIRFEQLMIGGSYKIQLDINDDIVIDDYQNNHPIIFDTLNVFACESWHPPADCSIKNLVIRTTPPDHIGNFENRFRKYTVQCSDDFSIFLSNFRKKIRLKALLNGNFPGLLHFFVDMFFCNSPGVTTV